MCGYSDFSLKGCRFLLYYLSCCLSETVIQRGKCKRRSDSPVEPPEALTGPLTARDCTSSNRIARPATGSVGCSSGSEGQTAVGEACANRAG